LPELRLLGKHGEVMPNSYASFDHFKTP